MSSWSAHLSTLFTELPLPERPGAAASAGFQSVETWWPTEGRQAWAAAVRRHGLRVSCLNADGGDLEVGERGFLNDRTRRDWVLDALDDALRLAAEVGAVAINVLPGRRLAASSATEQWEAATDTLRLCAERVAGTASSSWSST